MALDSYLRDLINEFSPGCTSATRKEQSRLPQDRWIGTRDGDTVAVKRNPKYPVAEPIPDTLPTF